MPVCNDWRRCTDDDTPERKMQNENLRIETYGREKEFFTEKQMFSLRTTARKRFTVTTRRLSKGRYPESLQDFGTVGAQQRDAM